MSAGSTTERSVVKFGAAQIAYAVHRSSRRRTVSIAVTPERAVVVTAPVSTPIARLDDVVHEKASWVLERLRRRSVLPPPPVKELVTGETFSYLGKQYRLRLERRPVVAPLRLVGGWLFLPVPHDLPRAEERAYARAALIDWYTRLARSFLPKRARSWAARVGVAPTAIVVSSTSTRWGSASRDGTVRINWRVTQCPTTLIDYVLLHELVHLRHPYHGRAFWAEVERVMPDYAQRKRRLVALGVESTW